VKQQSLTH